MKNILKKIRRDYFMRRDMWLPEKASYSQAQEDKIILEDYERTGGKLDKATQTYIDVGANHPTRLSNTYLLYRKGIKGFLVEPNNELNKLYGIARSSDVSIPCGMLDEPKLVPFYHSRNGAVMNTFHPDGAKHAWKTEVIPCFNLDALEPILGDKQVMLLSVDVEGLDLEVLRGATKILSRTTYVCVECNMADSPIAKILKSHRFRELAATAHNLIFKKE